MGKYTRIIAIIEKAPHGSRELDWEIRKAEATGHLVVEETFTPHWTTDFRDALRFIPPDWCPQELSFPVPKKGYYTLRLLPRGIGDDNAAVRGQAHDPILAVISAGFRAREQNGT